MEKPSERTLSFEARAVVPTTEGFTMATPRAGSIRTIVTSDVRDMLPRTEASHGDARDPIKKYAPLRIK
jgi:hypothetical protein